MRTLDVFLILSVFGSTVKSMGSDVNGTFPVSRRRRGLGYKTVCYHGLGCYYTGPPFKQIPFRPISVPPLHPEKIATLMLVYTRKNKYNPLSFPPSKPESIFRSHFNATAWTRILIHGYLDSTYSTSWLFDIKDEFLRLADENVIIVDRSSTILFPRIIYPQSVADSRLIGVQIANFITFIHEKLGVDMKKIHLIGHSLGAHIGGYVGERFPNLGRITGLDPAGPFFRQVARNVKLDQTDATFVDIIHSDPAPTVLGGYGTIEDLGHINFWPAGGRQRGCPLTVLRVLFNGVFPNELSVVFTCKHQRSFEFFLFSFNQSDCLFVGVECTSWNDYLQGKCNCGVNGEKCSIMGLFATPKPPPRRRYYLQVAAERPYCVHQYQIIVYLQTTGTISKSVQGPMQMSIFGDNHLLQKEISLNVDLSIPKQINTFFAISFQRIGKILSVESSSIEHIAEASTAVVEAIEVNYLYPQPSNHSEVKLCPSSSQKHDTRKNIIFSANNCH